MPNGLARTFWVVLVVLLLLTRIPAAARYLSIDNVNLALSLEKFDPNNHRPQPPGYPFFVGFARIVNLFFGNAERTFHVISVLVTFLCLFLTVLLGRRLFTQRAAHTAALLLLVNPVFWQSGLDGPLRPCLALFSLLTAYCSWRAWNGEREFVFWGALALGIGSGFRPDLLAFLTPLWLVSAWAGTRSFKVAAQGAAILGALVLVWVGALVYAIGGIQQLYSLTANYLVDQSSAESVVLGAAEQGWAKQLSRLVTWNGLAVVGWIWTVPFALSRERLRAWKSEIVFAAVWLIPGLIFQALVHVAAPGHTLFSIPAWCLVGAWAIWIAAERLAPPDAAPLVGEAAISAALVLNILLFLNYYPLPTAPVTPSFLQSVKNSAAYATYETSIGLVRSLDDVSEVTLRELKDLTAGDRPWVIVTTDVHDKDWFMNWRILRYYAPAADIWIMVDKQRPKLAQHVRRDVTMETRTGDLIEIPVPKRGRVIWLLEPGGAFYQALAKTQRFESRKQLLYTDLPADAEQFQVSNFNFVPREEHGIQ